MRALASLVRSECKYHKEEIIAGLDDCTYSCLCYVRVCHFVCVLVCQYDTTKKRLSQASTERHCTYCSMIIGGPPIFRSKIRFSPAASAYLMKLLHYIQQGMKFACARLCACGCGGVYVVCVFNCASVSVCWTYSRLSNMRTRRRCSASLAGPCCRRKIGISRWSSSASLWTRHHSSDITLIFCDYVSFNVWIVLFFSFLTSYRRFCHL